MDYKLVEDLKVLAIADTHGIIGITDAELVKMGSEVDFCIILGDVYRKEIIIIDNLLKNVCPVCGILGNHNDFSNYDRTAIENIHGQAITKGGIKIAGIEGSYKYKSGMYPMYSDIHSSIISNAIPDADILISHDNIKNLYADDDAHCGMQGINDYISRVNPILHFHGHYHKDDIKVFWNGTISIGIYGVKTIVINQVLNKVKEMNRDETIKCNWIHY